MGQDQSVLADDQIDEAQIRRRLRDEMRTARKRKPEAKRRADAFMKHTDAPNHIRAIREEKKERVHDDSFEGTFEIQDLVRKKKPPPEEFKASRLNPESLLVSLLSRGSRSLWRAAPLCAVAATPLSLMFSVEGKLTELPASDLPSQETESESSDDEDRGRYHFEVSTRKRGEPLAVTDPEAHPVMIEGERAVGYELHLKDESLFAREFPVFRVEWFLGLDVNDSDRFSVHFDQEGSLSLPYRIPQEAVGKFVMAKAYRNVEDQLQDTQLGGQDAGAYDPHVGGVRHSDYRPPPGVVKVCSTAVVGPVLISDACAYVLQKALSRGGFTCAIKLRDVFKADEYQGEKIISLDGARTAAKSRKKLPGTLRVDNSGIVEVAYRASDLQDLEDDSADGGIFGYLPVGGLLGRETTDRKRGGRRPGGDSDSESDRMERYATPLDKVYVRPSRGQNTMIVATEWRPLDEKKEGKQDILRLDIDPVVGRDNALYVVIGFQAAKKARRFDTREWKRLVDMGDLQEVKQMVERYLKEITSTATEKAPAFERMPTTPWAILNAPQSKSID
ncbi:hypothetical protein BESB_028140 [Besnoitia besnoiti]|uniref:Uncharacterized protein n=1 Tax=Besnoitia besnoiti TaxID=94643 RepID=A0A2A9M0A6_BESBE|nr:uncharacterized protein BESB_028140 [Besnoitia besnoiti]PFH31379.1 hypothetical protein BESB_028140 [Besnoitia besnoiti]